MAERLHFHFSLSCIGEGNGNLLHYSCLDNPRDGGAWWAAVYGVSQSRTWLKRLSSSSSSFNYQCSFVMPQSPPKYLLVIVANLLDFDIAHCHIPINNTDFLLPSSGILNGMICKRHSRRVEGNICWNQDTGDFNSSPRLPYWKLQLNKMDWFCLKKIIHPLIYSFISWWTKHYKGHCRWNGEQNRCTDFKKQSRRRCKDVYKQSHCSMITTALARNHDHCGRTEQTPESLGGSRDCWGESMSTYMEGVKRSWIGTLPG